MTSKYPHHAQVFCQPGIASAEARTLGFQKSRLPTGAQAPMLAERIWCSFLKQLVGCRKTLFQAAATEVQWFASPLKRNWVVQYCQRLGLGGQCARPLAHTARRAAAAAPEVPLPLALAGSAAPAARRCATRA